MSTDLSFDRWKSKQNAVVTGASTEIGAAIVRLLVQQGLRVFGVSRHVSKLRRLGEEFFTISGLYASGNFHAVELDMSNEQAIITKFESIRVEHGPIAILINNVAVEDISSLVYGAPASWERVVDVNLLGVSIASRQLIRMLKTQKLPGYIININNIVNITSNGAGMMYKASKYALKGITETFRQELAHDSSCVRISLITPKVGKTKVKPTSRDPRPPVLHPADVADAVYFILTTPPHVQIQDLVIRPVRDPMFFS